MELGQAKGRSRDDVVPHVDLEQSWALGFKHSDVSRSYPTVQLLLLLLLQSVGLFN